MFRVTDRESWFLRFLQTPFRILAMGCSTHSHSSRLWIILTVLLANLRELGGSCGGSCIGPTLELAGLGRWLEDHESDSQLVRREKVL